MSPEAVAARTKYFEEKKKKGKVTPLGVTNRDIEIALRRSQGDITEAAKFLGIHAQTCRQRINSSEYLITVRNQIIDEFLDETESQLKKLVKAGNPSAIFFVLKTLGKDRGYVEKATLEHELGPNAVKNAANMIEAMRRGMEDAPALPLPRSRLLTAEEDSATEDAIWVESGVDSSGDLQTVESG